VTVEIRPATLGERPAIQHLIDVAYNDESYGPSLANPCLSVGHSHLDPHDRPENTRLLLVEGQMVSAVHVLERQAYACGERIGFGLISDVCTHPDHRRRGYMRLLMADTERHMRERGLCYGVLFGGFARYGGSVGWHWCDEKLPTLRTAFLMPAEQEASKTCAAEATEDDVPFLASIYEKRYQPRFGPVVRSHAYWRRWSLQRPWEGRYVVVRQGSDRIGYFHIGNGIDELGWSQMEAGVAEQVLAAASSWAAEHGVAQVMLWLGESEEEALRAMCRLFVDLPRVFVDAMGHVTDDGDPNRMFQRMWCEGAGVMVKWLRRGPGPLVGVDSTEALTAVMAQHHWTMLDGDMA
jgi:GNAT superfamily N-acetyltransferase